jgi:sugar lactone lactonase YvrE
MRRSLLLGFALSSLVSFAAVRSDAAAPTVVYTLDPSQGQLPESITADDDGNVYLSMSNKVWKASLDGSRAPVLFAQLPIPPGAFALGLKVGYDGYLYAGSGSFNPADDASHVWRISPSGAVSEYAHLDPNGFPNDLAFDDNGYLYVTDPTFGILYRVDPGGGNATVWLDDPLLQGNPAAPVFVVRPFGCDGIAFDKKKRDLYLGNLDYGEILRVHVGDDDEPAGTSVFASDPRLIGNDGIAFDKKGTLFVAVNAQNQIAAIDGAGGVSIIAQGGALDGPSSLVFGTKGNDKKNLYISSFAIAEALGLAPGAPRPSLLKLPMTYGGLSLP